MYEHSSTKDALVLIEKLSAGIISWYEFKKDADVLFIGKENAAAFYLRDLSCHVTIKSPDEINEDYSKANNRAFFYVVIPETIELIKDPLAFLKKIHFMLEPEGHVLIATDNRLGLKYFCGDSDPYTGRNLDGVEGYRRIRPERRGELKGRLYSKSELDGFLNESGFVRRKYYSVFPNVKEPQFIFAEDREDIFKLKNYRSLRYNSPELVFMDERQMTEDIKANGMFMQMANAFFIDCSPAGDFDEVTSVELMPQRLETSLKKTIFEDEPEKVEIKALYPEGILFIETAIQNEKILTEKGIKVIHCSKEGDNSVVYNKKGEDAWRFLQMFIQSGDEAGLYAELDRIRELIISSSKTYEDGKYGTVLETAFLHLDISHSVYSEGEYIFYPQFYRANNIPVDVLMINTINGIFTNWPRISPKISSEDILKHYGIFDNRNIIMRPYWDYFGKLCRGHAFSGYNIKHELMANTVPSNRVKLAYTKERYAAVFENIFSDIAGKDIYLFGSGNYAKDFMDFHGKDVEVKGILDNKSDNWNKELSGVKIVSPESVKGKDNIKVIICIRNYDGIFEQLTELGIDDYCVYDPDIQYPRPGKIQKTETVSPEGGKPYHIGYVAGVFDMFHMGHVNLLRRAKEQCDHLIVGVLSDKGVVEDKKTSPYMTCEDRMEIVRACRYADEVNEIPFEHPGIEDAYKMYHFDAMFSGNDHDDDTAWMARKKFLEDHGSALVFFPYTKGVSTTELKKKTGFIK